MADSKTYHNNFSHPTPYQQYTVAIAEDLSQKYKALIDSERKHFIHLEGEYNQFIYQLDMLYKELLSRYEAVQKDNERLFQDNQDLTRTLKKIQQEDVERSNTLKNMYFAYQKQTMQLKELEKAHNDLKDKLNAKHEKTLVADIETKTAVAHQNILQERLEEVEARLHAEIDRRGKIIDDRDRYISDIEKKLDDYANLNLRVTEEHAQIKLDLATQKSNYEGILHKQRLEIEHLRRDLDDERVRSKAYQNFLEAQNTIDKKIRTKDLVVKPDTHYYEEEIRRQRKELEVAHQKINELRRNPPEPRVDYKDIFVVAGHLDDFAERADKAMSMSERNHLNRIRKTYAFALWKLLQQNDNLKEKLELIRDDPKNTALMKEAPQVIITPEVSDIIEKLDGVFSHVKKTIMETVLEIFIRSANHAHEKKLNSFIIFVVNMEELKPEDSHLLIAFIETYEMLKEILSGEKREKSLKDTQVMAAVQKYLKAREVDIEFRDNINTWIEETLDQIDKKRDYSKDNEVNREYLHLFRLLALKYRCVNPMSHKKITIDPDLQIQLEDKICRSFLRGLQSRAAQEQP